MSSKQLSEPVNSSNTGYRVPTRKYGIPELLEINKLFDELGSAKWIKRAVYAAGLGATFDMLHLAWLALRFIFKF